MAGDTVHRVERVLDVRQGQLCWVTGTIYMDMPLKPNILDDISKDVRESCVTRVYHCFTNVYDLDIALDCSTATARKVRLA